MSSLKQLAYQRIREMLLTGRLEGGSRISDVSLAQELGISRTPVREAIIQLEAEGLIQQLPRVGAFVRTLTRAEIEQLYDLRELLESHSAAQAALRIDEHQLAQLRRLCRQMVKAARTIRAQKLTSFNNEPGQHLLLNDIAFHMLLVKVTGNPWLAKSIDDSRLVTRLVTQRQDQSPAQLTREMARACREHLAILRALTQQDSAASEQAMRQHIRTARTLRLQWHDWAQRQAQLAQVTAPWPTLPQQAG